MGNFAYILGCSAAFCTAFYSFRLVFLTFVNVPNSFKTYVEHAHVACLISVLVRLGGSVVKPEATAGGTKGGSSARFSRAREETRGREGRGGGERGGRERKRADERAVGRCFWRLLVVELVH